ncbi:MAG TPA: hypothetical protein VI454_18040, partial [Verrucomicrobiae bacterium]
MANVQTVEPEVVEEQEAETREAEEEKIKKQENVRQALKQTPKQDQPPKPVAQTKDKVWFGGYVLVLIGLGALYYLFSLNFFGLSE